MIRPTRRALLASAAAGALVFAVDARGALARLVDGEDDDPLAPDLFVSLAPDGTLTVVAHRSEMGTGIRTALPLIIADELGADWNRVVVAQATGDPRYGDQNTDGSRSVRQFHGRMRRAGATLRTMLTAAAAERFGVDAGECEARDHRIVHAASGRSVDFGDLVADARRRPVPAQDELVLRDPSAWRLAGPRAMRDVPITDLDAIVTGRAEFGIDARHEGQLFAVVARPPVAGGRVRAFDDAAARAVPGVVDVVELPAPEGAFAFQPLGGVAVLATGTHAALAGRSALGIEWDGGPNADYDSAAYEAELTQAARTPGRRLRAVGDADAVLGEGPAEDVHEADYHVPHLAHAPLEPPCALARVDVDGDGTVVGCTCRAPTQNPQAARDEVARALGLAPEAVRIEVTLLGGGFGRKSKPDFVVEAALLARAVGRPVHLLWTREDELAHGYYHAVASVHVRARIDRASGLPTAWLQRSAFPPIGSTFSREARHGSAGELGQGFTDLPYDVPNLAVESAPAVAHVRIGWLRSVAHVYHAFATCSFPDELAHRAGRDPLEYLLELLGPDREVALDGVAYPNHGRSLAEYPVDTGRLRRVTERAAALADWGRELPRGRGLGIACHRSFLSYCANVVEVEVTPAGVVRIGRVWVALDAGLIVHPDRVRAQMEGAASFGATLALFGEVTFAAGAAERTNFHTYPIARLHESPREVHVEILTSDAPPGGVGEVGVPPFAPALTNAVFAATGKRVRRLPLARHDLSWS